MSKCKDRHKLFEELRHLVQDIQLDEYYKSDGYLLRWLQYANYDVQKSAICLRKSTEWRIANKIDLVLNENFDDLTRRFPVDLSEIDKHGRIIVKASCDKFDCKNLNFEQEWKHMVRFAYWIQLKIEKRIEEQYYNSGQTVSQGIAIIDCHKIPELMKQVGIRKLYRVLMLVKELVSNLENNFPRGIAVTYVINAPRIFYLIYSGIKHLFCSETANSFQVHRTENSFDWRTELCAA